MLLWTILGIFVLPLIFLCFPASIRFSYRSIPESAVGFSVHFLFFRIRLLPERPEKQGKGRQEKPERKKKKGKEKKPDRPRSAADTIQLIRSILKASKQGLNLIRRHLIFYRVKIYIAAGGEDAHQTAVFYGKVNGAVFSILSLVGQSFVLREPDVHIAPDFLSEKSKYDISLRLRIVPMIAVIAFALAFFSSLRAINIQRKKNKEHKAKDGKKHESAASAQ